MKKSFRAYSINCRKLLENKIIENVNNVQIKKDFNIEYLEIKNKNNEIR